MNDHCSVHWCLEYKISCLHYISLSQVFVYIIIYIYNIGRFIGYQNFLIHWYRYRYHHVDKQARSVSQTAKTNFLFFSQDRHAPVHRFTLKSLPGVSTSPSCDPLKLTSFWNLWCKFKIYRTFINIWHECLNNMTEVIRRKQVPCSLETKQTA